MDRQEIFIQGHRGCRALFPENSLSAFLHASKLGVDAIELDICVSADKQLIVAHEPIMLHDLCLKPNGEEILVSEENQLNLFKMKAEEIKSYSFGTLPHKKFPLQQKVKSHKLPLLELLGLLEKELGDNLPQLTIEIKSTTEGDGKYHPGPDAYTDLFLKTLDSIDPQWPIVVQSFDVRILKALDKKGIDVPLTVLNADKAVEVDAMLEELGFIPEGWGSLHDLIDQELVETCFTFGMDLSAWTVNDKQRADELFQLGVRNFITDTIEIW